MPPVRTSRIEGFPTCGAKLIVASWVQGFTAKQHRSDNACSGSAI